TSSGNYRVVMTIGDPSKVKDAREAVQKKVDVTDTAGWSFSSSGATLSWSLTGAAQKLLSDSATDQAYKIIDSRINAIGVAEPTLQRRGGQNWHENLLEMPGISDPEHVKQLLAGQSHLELVHVISPASPMPAQTYIAKEEAIASLNSGTNIPANRRVLPYTERQDATTTPEQSANAPKPQKWVVVESPAIIDGIDLRTAQAIPERAGGDKYQISFSLKKSGADKFGAWTGANINEYMGVVLNDEVKSIAFIKSQIFDQGEITGNFTKEQGEDLALTLRSGALPAPIEYSE